jgi:hypothetical protein
MCKQNLHFTNIVVFPTGAFSDALFDVSRLSRGAGQSANRGCSPTILPYAPEDKQAGKAHSDPSSLE